MTSHTSGQLTRLLNILITLLAVTACAPVTHHVQVSDVQAPPSRQIHHHIVARGETLYSIAWRHNLDYKKFAQANGISSDYRIYPGQVLQLRESVTAPAPRPVPPTKTLKQPAAVQPDQTTRSIKETPPRITPVPTPISHSPPSWVWPANGTLIATFNSNRGLNKGIDIRGKLEDAVLAAASGTVVYAGEGLRGYGKLIIIKHSEKYLSAYAHNHQLLVNEGASVKQGQRIASMGASGTDSVKLHFEIRDDGQPVDPLKYLPRR